MDLIIGSNVINYFFDRSRNFLLFLFPDNSFLAMKWLQSKTATFSFNTKKNVLSYQILSPYVNLALSNTASVAFIVLFPFIS